MTKLSDINSSREVVVVTFKEVTEHKKAVAAAKVTLAKAGESSTHKSRLTSAFAHELRNPINNILACSKLLENNTQPEVDTKKLDYLQRIQVNVKRINQLLDDLLLIGKIETGQIQLKPALMDLTEFCRRVMKELQQDAGSQHKITFSTQGKPCGVWDEKLLRQTLMNLLLNAIQSSPKGSEIQLEVVGQGRQVIFRIQDSGNGIPEEEQELLGNAFQEGTNVGLIEGNSLRLLLVKQCVEVQKGEIFIENQVDVGTTFTVTLPLNQRVAKKK
jgi:signal transduction histidine kinase